MAESLCKMVEAQITQVLALVSKWTKYYQATLLRVIRKMNQNTKNAHITFTLQGQEVKWSYWNSRSKIEKFLRSFEDGSWKKILYAPSEVVPFYAAFIQANDPEINSCAWTTLIILVFFEICNVYFNCHYF